MQRQPLGFSTFCRFDSESVDGRRTPTFHFAAVQTGQNGHEPRSLQNVLLQSLPIQDLKPIIPLLERIPLTPRRVLQHDKTHIEHLYFIEDGVVAVLAAASERRGVEVGMIGREGVVGIPAVLGPCVSPHRSLVQLGGSAYRIKANQIRRAFDEMPSLRTALLQK